MKSFSITRLPNLKLAMKLFIMCTSTTQRQTLKSSLLEIEEIKANWEKIPFVFYTMWGISGISY